MRVLLDSHTLIWAADQPEKIPARVTSILIDSSNQRLLSAATIWEIAIKVGKKQLPLSMDYRDWIEKATQDLCLTLLPIELKYTDVVVQLPRHHQDPFDRLMIAQAFVESIPILGCDIAFDDYDITRIWE